MARKSFEYRSIIEKIKSRVQLKKRSLRVDNISPGVVSILREDGYTVSVETYRTDDYDAIDFVVDLLTFSDSDIKVSKEYIIQW